MVNKNPYLNEQIGILKTKYKLITSKLYSYTFFRLELHFFYKLEIRNNDIGYDDY